MPATPACLQVPTVLDIHATCEKAPKVEWWLFWALGFPSYAQLLFFVRGLPLWCESRAGAELQHAGPHHVCQGYARAMTRRAEQPEIFAPAPVPGRRIVRA